MSCKFATPDGPLIRTIVVFAAAILLLISGTASAAETENPPHDSDIVTTVRRMLDTLRSPVSYRMDKIEAYRYWCEKKQCISLAEHAFGKDYPWCDDPDYSILQHRQIAAMNDVQYEYFIDLWERCFGECGKRNSRPCDYCGDPLYLSVRQKRIEEMTGHELDFFIRCRRGCISTLIDSGYCYRLSLDKRYQEALRGQFGAMTAQQKIFVNNVAYDAEKRNRKKAADAGISIAAMAVPTILIVVFSVLVYVIAAEFNVRL